MKEHQNVSSSCSLDSEIQEYKYLSCAKEEENKNEDLKTPHPWILCKLPPITIFKLDIQ